MLYTSCRSVSCRLLNFLTSGNIQSNIKSFVAESSLAKKPPSSINSSSPISLITKKTSKHKPFLGMTLIELMVSISITSILTSIALPNFSSFIVQLRVDNEISRLSRLLLVARNYSINSGRNVIICPLVNNGDCSTNWHEQISVFIDNNGNKKFDSAAGELLITTKEVIKFGDTLTYATNRTSITYQPTGHLFGLSNGTFRYCPKDFEDKSRGIVVARSGRFYATTDLNNDGIDETRSKKVIKCN